MGGYHPPATKLQTLPSFLGSNMRLDAFHRNAPSEKMPAEDASQQIQFFYAAVRFLVRRGLSVPWLYSKIQSSSSVWNALLPANSSQFVTL